MDRSAPVEAGRAQPALCHQEGTGLKLWKPSRLGAHGDQGLVWPLHQTKECCPFSRHTVLPAQTANSDAEVPAEGRPPHGVSSVMDRVCMQAAVRMEEC